MLTPWLLRTALEVLARTDRPAEDGPDEVETFDLVGLPFKLKLPSRRRAAPEPYLTVHVTAVKGGFGTSARQRARADLPRYPDLEPAEAALLLRYHDLAYHRIASRLRGGSDVRNHPPELRTSASNHGNKGMAWACDCGADEVLSERFSEAARHSLRLAIDEAHEASGRTVIVVPHRAWSGSRRRDTAAWLWRHVVTPVVDAHPHARIGWEVRYGSGRPIPRSWDDRALFDDKGRRVKPSP